jgi:peptidyl-prolyl cis-trans isomerase SurA
MGDSESIMNGNSPSGRLWLAHAALVCGCVVAGVLPGHAQSTSLPGLVITPTTPPVRQKDEVKPAAPAKRPAPQREAKAAESGSPSRGSGQGIVALVNDEPVTGYEVQQRAAFLAVSGGGAGVTERARENLKNIAQQESTSQRMRAILEETVKANPGKTREQVIAAFEERKKAFVQSLQRQAVESAKASLVPKFKKQALEELIDERLKLQEAKRLTLNVSDEEADKIFKGIAERNKMTEQQFSEHLKAQGIDARTMKGRLRAQSAWRDVIRRKYGPQISVTARDVDKYVEASGATAGEDQTELQLQKLTLSIPGKIDQKVMAKRLEEAEALRRKFSGCKSMKGLAGAAAGATFEDMGYTKVAGVAEPTRSLLLSAKDGEMVPGNLAQSGVELYAVCGRRTIKADEQKRQQVQEELTQKEFDVLARRHLRDLRQDAMIEYK